LIEFNQRPKDPECESNSRELRRKDKMIGTFAATESPSMLDLRRSSCNADVRGPQKRVLNLRVCMERRERIRFGVHAAVDFEWLDEEGVRQQGRGLTRDISPRGLQKPIFKSRFFSLLSMGPTQISSLELGHWSSAGSQLWSEGVGADLRFLTGAAKYTTV